MTTVSQAVHRKTANDGDVWRAVRLTFPILFGFLPVGLAFGLYATRLGLPWYGTVMLSTFVYAGSSEFIAAAMIAANESFLKIAVTGFFVNFRHMFYGLSVHTKIPERGFLRFYTIATLSDETFALIASVENKSRRLNALVAFLNHFYWFGSVALGAVLGNRLGLDLRGIEFCLPALFVVLAVEQWLVVRTVSPFFVGLLFAVVAHLLCPDYMLMGAILAAVAVLLAVGKERERVT